MGSMNNPKLYNIALWLTLTLSNWVMWPKWTPDVAQITENSAIPAQIPTVRSTAVGTTNKIVHKLA